MAHPAGVSEPPWILPGKSSIPVNRQPIPRMWLSPSPRKLVADAVQDQGTIAKRLQRRQALFQLERRTFLVGPERLGDNAVGAEHDDQPLLAPLLIREAEAGQIQDERERRCADAQVANKLASVASVESCQVSGRRLGAGVCPPVLTLEFTTLDYGTSKPTSP